jgi:hypothetical protein
VEESPGLVVRAEVARKQMDADRQKEQQREIAVVPGKAGNGPAMVATIETPPGQRGGDDAPKAPVQPTRFHGEFELYATRIGRDAGRLADEVIAHLTGLVGANVKVTLEVTAEIPSGVPQHVVRGVTENLRTLKYYDHGFETE